jgi:hypothetical protein
MMNSPQANRKRRDPPVSNGPYDRASRACTECTKRKAKCPSVHFSDQSMTVVLINGPQARARGPGWAGFFPWAAL